MARRLLGCLFLALALFSLFQCARRGTPSGGPKDVTPPVLVEADPDNMSLNFDEKRIRLYFDEFIKLEDVQEQLIISPPLKYDPIITPQGSANKYVEINLKDTLKPNTTYTFNFGQSIVDNNEGNPASYLHYVFATGDYLDSLSVKGAVKDAFNNEADDFISVMLYTVDSTYSDSIVYQRPPDYLTNTLDSTVFFDIKNLKAGTYRLIAIKDENKNNLFDQNQDKIGFLENAVTLPTDSLFLLNLFKEAPNYKASVPSMVASNRIQFGFVGDYREMAVSPMTPLPDSVQYLVRKFPGKDTLNFWFTPFETDSIVFHVLNETRKVSDTFTVKTRKLAADSLIVGSMPRGALHFGDSIQLTANTPILTVDTALVSLRIHDSIPVPFKTTFLDRRNSLSIHLEPEPNSSYTLEVLPGALTDFFGSTNDTLQYSYNTKSYADYGNLEVQLAGAVSYPVMVQLTDEKGTLLREVYITEATSIPFNHLEPAKYRIRVIHDTNGNKVWDTGSYLEGRQPERVSHYPNVIEMRANWEKVETFTIQD